MKEINEEEKNKKVQRTQETKGSLHAKKPIESVEEAYGIEDDEHYAG